MSLSPEHPIKKMLPRSFYGRALLILVLPTVLVQLLASYLFYERHWDNVVRHLSNSLAGEVTLLVKEYANHPSDEDRLERIQALARPMGIEVQLLRDSYGEVDAQRGRDLYPQFYHHLKKRITLPFMVEAEGPEGDILISIQTTDGVLELFTTRKRLASSTTYIFISWMAGLATLLLLIAVIFLRNQVRPIRQLAEAAERFGLGQDMPEFKPSGAREIRQAAQSFLIMKERIERQVRTRTEMLAGISHDLRTPLTRMKLQLAMLGEKAAAEFKQDVEQMEHMIQEYLDFARGQGAEEPQPVEAEAYVMGIVKPYLRDKQPVEAGEQATGRLTLRPQAMRRAIQNLLDNALRYGQRAQISSRWEGRDWLLIVEDDGPGIDEAKMEEVFKPFTRLDPSRNVATGGAGLGLTIARDVVQGHGGTLSLKNRENGGLRAEIRLPQ